MSNAREIDLLNAAFTAMMPGYTFVTEKEYRERQNSLIRLEEQNSLLRLEEQNSFIILGCTVFQPVDLYAFHQCILAGGYVDNGIDKENELSMTPKSFGILTLSNNVTIQIFVKMLDGRRKTLIDYDITRGCTLHLTLNLYGGGNIISYLSTNFLAPKYNFDFTNIDDKDQVYTRGGVQYQRPCGWQRFALRVTGKYDNDNYGWLGTDANAWPVSYHGTSKNNSKSIAEQGYLLSKGRRFKHGYGIYSTPEINIAKLYAKKFEFCGDNFLVVIQNRVNPKDLQKIPKDITQVGEYWISEKGEDIRPYGICIKKLL
ncbi:13181_t:CDS:2 [Dentiscutata heterogama]|uniref:13181_t:CDS:1 n=1 Tax=Dentiscutata heterogama TaxID=1316150 RepID=A0ACA9KHT5_9GLOM|nr:13181_t:CDS:2 [Dentiscutata heterogama]